MSKVLRFPIYAVMVLVVLVKGLIKALFYYLLWPIRKVQEDIQKNAVRKELQQYKMELDAEEKELLEAEEAEQEEPQEEEEVVESVAGEEVFETDFETERKKEEALRKETIHKHLEEKYEAQDAPEVPEEKVIRRVRFQQPEKLTSIQELIDEALAVKPLDPDEILEFVMDDQGKQKLVRRFITMNERFDDISKAGHMAFPFRNKVKEGTNG